jgi:hypothetical protein
MSAKRKREEPIPNAADEICKKRRKEQQEADLRAAISINTLQKLGRQQDNMAIAVAMVTTGPLLQGSTRDGEEFQVSSKAAAQPSFG